MRPIVRSSMTFRMTLMIAFFVACFSSTIGEGQAQLDTAMAPPPVDTVTTKDGKSVSGQIVSMQDGKINVDTEQGTTSLEVDSVAGFVIEREPAGAVAAAPPIDPVAIGQILSAQQEILQRLDALAVAFANLEQQLRTVQTNQVIESRRLTERTFEANPLAKVVVVSSNIVRNGNNTIVVGQVMNQSESTVTNLQVQATLVGSKGKLGNVGGSQAKTGQVLPPVLGPGQMGTFEVPFSGSFILEDVRVDVSGHPGQFQVPIQSIPQGFGEY